ncbi:helix-turn-helix domain-containing protein [Paenibacillus agri]|uniref:Helix-turn-helix domain-containing protein n=1 Tax=Paenibacillus agri TaxID=2744309 RepID=A0A850EP42_9BACL|nr:helix-turn-helix domain-containing protein [Paenibacillus agri]NUU61529.1 helix-turn-helix domain-containing protein [Paenibacillus agri]
METKDDPGIIPDREILELLRAAKQGDTEAMLQLIDLYEEDILRISKFIHLPEEDAVSAIILEFLEFIQRETEAFDRRS